MKIATAFYLIGSLVLCSSVNASVTPNPLFSDNAVLQQKTPIPVWGSVAEVPLLTDSIAPIRTKVRGGILFADFGKDYYGNLELVFRNHIPSDSITVRLGEKLTERGDIDRNPPGSVNYREIVITPKVGLASYRLDIPRKPQHNDPSAVTPRSEIGEITPFRYAEIEGVGLDASTLTLSQLAVHAPFQDRDSSFESSDPGLNQVWELCKHTMKATTALGLFIDGERERIPYEGDAYINQLSFAATDPDPSMTRATFDRLMEHPTWPTEWGLHMPMIAAADYEITGETLIVGKHYDQLKKRLLDRTIREDGLLVASAIVDWPAGERDGYNDGVVATDQPKQAGPLVNTVANAFYIHALEKMSLLAKALEKKSDAADFELRASKARASFNRVFLNPKTGIYLDGEGSSHSSLHANMFPLAFGLVPLDHRASVGEFVRSRGMACSVYGAQYLLEALFAAGFEREAIALMASNSSRSWRHMIDEGSTMTWEAWDPSVKPNLTWNHAWGSAPANILSRFVLGVRPLIPGYGKVLVAPELGDLTSVRGTVPTVRGPIKVNVSNGISFQLQVTLPPGVTGEARLPRRGEGLFMLDGKQIPTVGKLSKEKSLVVKISQGYHVLQSK